MRLFRPWYERVLKWSEHPKAPSLLGFLSFIEAIIFPVPPEVMLAPMTLAKPKKWFWYATISLIGSLLGAFVGYALGMFALNLIEPLIQYLGLMPKFEEVKIAAAENGFWFLLVGGFVPIPFKLLTIASGVVGMPLLPFFFGALIGRGKRVYLLAGMVRLFGPRAQQILDRHIERIGWAVVVTIVAAGLAYLLWPATGA
ncbi:MAG: DedA family protein [Ahniella sp.]|nr:DedA family protein [Ahniella sp.]